MINAQYQAIGRLAVPESGPTNVLLRRVSPAPTHGPDSGPTLVLKRRAKGTEPPAMPSDAALLAREVFEARLLAILDSPLMSIETPTQGFDRKERALGNAFAELAPRDAAALSARLSINYTCDVLARKFNKLADERRTRLLCFLRLIASPS